MHIRPLSNPPGFQGEFTIEDLGIFSDSGRLAKVARMWSAITRYALLVDKTHAEAVEGVKRRVAATSASTPATEDELDDYVMAEMDFQILSDSDSYVVKSLLFLMLASFNQFALKEIYKLIKPRGSVLPRRNVVTHILETLRTGKIVVRVPCEYRKHFLKKLDPVRNNFAHGDWTKLGRTLKTLDLSMSFQAVAAYFLRIQEKLRDRQFNV